jgi:tetratricopeptide (TPR) repeat protein
MGLFDIIKKNNSDNLVWRNVNGEIVCPGDACPKECDDTCPIFLNTVALSLMRIGENEKSLEVCKEILKMAPDFDEVYNNMAAIYGGEGKYQEAYDCYLKSHELNKVRPNPIYGLALCCRDLNRPEECIKWCEEYARFSTDNRLEDLYAEMKAKLGEEFEDDEELEDKDDYEFVEEGEEWSIVKKDDYYFFIDEYEDYATTPRGDLLRTCYIELAERILEDLDTYGPDDFSADSILPWHYTMVENFSRMEHKAVEDVLADSFINRYDWTYTVNAEDTSLEDIWGVRGVREGEIMEWLHKITNMQMTAACCIGNAYHTINIAYMLAIIMETCDSDEREAKFEELADIINENSEFYANVDDFINFELYYGIHLKENGNVITD